MVRIIASHTVPAKIGMMKKGMPSTLLETMMAIIDDLDVGE